jgi:hypothetical protein
MGWKPARAETLLRLRALARQPDRAPSRGNAQTPDILTPLTIIRERARNVNNVSVNHCEDSMDKDIAFRMERIKEEAYRLSNWVMVMLFLGVMAGIFIGWCRWG